MRGDSFAYKIEDVVKVEIIDAVNCYSLAELRAGEYFKLLYKQLTLKAYIPILTNDFKSWKHKHVNHSILPEFLYGKPDSKDYSRYIQWMNHSGKLDAYLERSISYIFMRDMGKDLALPETQSRVRSTVDKLKEALTRSTSSKEKQQDGFSSIAWLLRKAQKENIESSIIWLIEKLKSITKYLPEEIDSEQSKRKLIKIIAGVLMHESDGMDDKIPEEERSRRLEAAVRLGYSYGLTYPFIDDLLDANVLSQEEKSRYSELIRTTLTTGSVPELGEWKGKNGELVRFIHSELGEAFEYIKLHKKPELMNSFLEQAYVFYYSQEIDRRKVLSDSSYSNEDLYVPVILKSSSSRLIARSITGSDEDSGFDNRTFYYGIYNQLADDFADMYDDLKEGAVTPYTYYIKHHNQRPDLVNPFELYWSVISNLIHNVYRSDLRTCDVILSRAINGLKRYKVRVGDTKYKEIMALFTANIPEFNKAVQKMVQKAKDVDFFDKLLRDQMITSLKSEKAQAEAFKDTMRNVREQINSSLAINKTKDKTLPDNSVVDAVNYCLDTDGKRLRPMISWVMGTDVYGLKPEAIMPLLRSLEYMHTASLIFDDLPSQDNADIRRGRPALHKEYDIATAELASLFLTQKAVEEQACLEQFRPETILQLIRYSSGVTQSMCQGQMMDLGLKDKKLSLEQLNTICFYKTGIAFEASLIMPAILAQANECEIEALKKYARYAGIAFQIKDDILDQEGDPDLLGKVTGKDVKNKNSTFVTVLGLEDAKKEMWNHYCNAIEALEEIPGNTGFLRQLLNYIINRDY